VHHPSPEVAPPNKFVWIALTPDHQLESSSADWMLVQKYTLPVLKLVSGIIDQNMFLCTQLLMHVHCMLHSYIDIAVAKQFSLHCASTQVHTVCIGTMLCTNIWIVQIHHFNPHRVHLTSLHSKTVTLYIVELRPLLDNILHWLHRELGTKD